MRRRVSASPLGEDAAFRRPAAGAQTRYQQAAVPDACAAQFAPIARALVAMTGGTGTVDFLAFFEVDRDRRSGHEQRREQQEYKSIEHHSRPPNNSMRRIVARRAASGIDANHA